MVVNYEWNAAIKRHNERKNRRKTDTDKNDAMIVKALKKLSEKNKTVGAIKLVNVVFDLMEDMSALDRTSVFEAIKIRSETLNNGTPEKE